MEAAAKMYEDLAKAQSEFPEIPKDKTAKKRGLTKKGEQFEYEYHYTSLELLIKLTRPALAKNGFCVTQSVSLYSEGNPTQVLVTKLGHKSGQEIESCFPLTAEADMQKWGASTSYAKRYGWQMAIGVSPDEDLDANDLGDESFSAAPREQKQPVAPSNKLSAAQAVGGVAERMGIKLEPNKKNEFDPGEYVKPFGKYDKGMKLKDLGLNKIAESLKWAKDQAKPSKSVLEFIDAASQFLELAEARANAPQIPDHIKDWTKTAVGHAPSMDEHDDLPF